MSSSKFYFFPILLLSLFSGMNVYAQEFDFTKIFPTDDAFTLTDLNDPDDSRGFNNMHTGEKDFLKVWYAWNATQGNEKIITANLLKFDLSEVDVEKINHAKLKLKPFIVMTEEPREVTVFKISNNTWTESSLSWNTGPSFGPEKSYNFLVSESDKWYEIDVTDSIKENSETQISFVLTMKTLYPGLEEQIVFHSKESIIPENSPYIEIEYGDVGGGCLIATATYGTELAPQVQQLREIRDNTLLQTSSGKSFVESFNAFYYSFSPEIADLERQSPAFKEIVKIAITPMITSLSILNHADIDSEEEMISYGISMITLNLAMYFGLPILAILRISKLHHSYTKTS